MVTKSKVDPDTGYTPEQQLEAFNNVFSKKPKRKLARNPDPVATDKPQTKSVDLKTQAVNLYGQGLSAKDVAKTLSITYANAYYYKRFVGADVAKARLDQALARV
jgi:hypothetical protein